MLVVEARKKSGALITVDYALEQGKSVYAVPGRLGDPLSEGCNLLLAQGAAPACSPEQLLEELGISAAAKDCGSRIRETEQLEKNLRELCAQLQAGPAGLVKLREALGWELGKLSSAIVDLQLQGYIEELQPGIYRLVSR